MPPDEDVAALYRDLQSVPLVAQRLRLSESTTYRILSRLGIVRTGQNKPNQRRLPDSAEQALADEYRAGASLNQLAVKHDISVWVVRAAVARQGLTPRRRGGVVRDVPMERARDMVRLYGEGLSQQDIAIRHSVSQSLVSRVLHRAGANTRPVGEAHSAWRGGRTRTGEGYWQVWVGRDDPLASMRNRMGYVPEHRFVMAQALGRPLGSHETVHHINGDKADNRLENLQLRQGRHGNGVVMACLDCGSHNVAAVPIHVTED